MQGWMYIWLYGIRWEYLVDFRSNGISLIIAPENDGGSRHLSFWYDFADGKMYTATHPFERLFNFDPKTIMKAVCHDKDPTLWPRMGSQ